MPDAMTTSQPAARTAIDRRAASAADAQADAARVVASFRCYAELNDFLAPGRRYREFDLACASDASAKHLIETLGIPHTEVELILVNGVSVGFAERVRAGDRVAVYPQFEAFDVAELLRVRPQPLRVTRFLADAHLGGLARLLRMAGFDTRHENALDDAELTRLAQQEGRIVLTRDRDLLKRRAISHGCYVHATHSHAQFQEILARLDLAGSLRPLSLCLDCNAPLQPVDKALVIDALPASVRERHHCFSSCAQCRRVFWEGSHWQRMREYLATAVAAATSVAATPTPVATALTPFPGKADKP